MSTVPKGRADRLAYYESHIDQWVQNAQAMDLDAELVARLQSRTIQARQALREQQQARQKARSATARFNQAMSETRTLGAGVLQQIQSKVPTMGDGVYTLASISPPKQKSPIAPPGQPYGFEFELRQTGTLKLSWKCKNPKGAEGTMYQIYRRDGISGPFVRLGSSGKKRFIDKTLPRGVPFVMYQIQAVRTTSAGDVAMFSINFGTGNPLHTGAEITTKRCA